MKIIFTFAFLLFTLSLSLVAQNGSVLWQNDRINFRSAPITPMEELAPFYHGVASGDPMEDRVIIWTRVTPDDFGENMDIEVAWEIGTSFDTIDGQVFVQDIVTNGSFTTNAERDFTVKEDVTGLSSNTTYYYQFSVQMDNAKVHSLIGRTRTTPTGDEANHLRFGVVSCSNFPAGYFNAYQRLSERGDLDAVIHLGDYIYEYGNLVYGDSTLDRLVEPNNEILSLQDYRTRYSTYRLDTSLLRVHQQHPFITVWDDHESANDAYMDGAENHTDSLEGDWEVRKAISKQVYFEWMPIRDNETQDIFRTLRYGNLMDLIMLDTRLKGREKQILDFFAPELQDTNRTLLGSEQKAWLFNELGSSTAKWKVIGQQIIFAELNIGWTTLLDQSLTFGAVEGIAQDIWDGYPAERQEILSYLEDNAIDNVVILTGDFHSAFAYDVPKQPTNLTFTDIPGVGNLPFYNASESYDPATGSGSLAVEFATPSVTSANFDENFDPQTAFIAQLQINQPLVIPNTTISLGNPNPHMKYADLIQHGYFVLDVKPDSVQADWYYTPINTVTDVETTGLGWYTLDGENHLRKADQESAPKTESDEAAPLTGVEDQQKEIAKYLTILSVFPNPFTRENNLHYAVQQTADVAIQLVDINGKLIRSLINNQLNAGLYTLQLDGSDLPKGVYFYRINVNGLNTSVKVLLK